MKLPLTILFALIVGAGFGQSKKADSSLFIHKLPNGTSMHKADLLLFYDFGKVAICFNKCGDPIANYPYKVIFSRHAIIIYKFNKKVGAFTYYKKSFQLTDLKLN